MQVNNVTGFFGFCILHRVAARHVAGIVDLQRNILAESLDNGVQRVGVKVQRQTRKSATVVHADS